VCTNLARQDGEPISRHGRPIPGEATTGKVPGKAPRSRTPVRSLSPSVKGERLLHSAFLLAAAVCLAGPAPSPSTGDGGSCSCDAGDSCSDSGDGFSCGGPFCGPYPGFGFGPGGNCGWGCVAGAYQASGWWCPPGCDCPREGCLKRLCSHFRHRADDNQSNGYGPPPPPGWYNDACWDNYAGGAFGGYCTSCGYGSNRRHGQDGGWGPDGSGEQEHGLRKLCGRLRHRNDSNPSGCGPWGCYPPGSYFGGYISEGCEDCWSE
jgi:hypothetical protein